MLRTMKYGVNAAVLAGLVAAPVLWAGVDKSVHLIVDGHERTVSTTADRVGQVLDAHGYRVSAHDIVAPSTTTAVADGASIVLRRGRLLNLNVDGRQTHVWTTAPTVDDALAQLGYAATDFVSVSRSRRLPLGATDIAIRTPMIVSVIHDGTQDQVSTTDPTVGAVLADLGIKVASSDRLSASINSAVHTDELIRLQRVAKRIVTRTEALPYPTSTHRDAALSAGTTRLLTSGRKGTAKVTYVYVYVDGKLAGRTEVTSQTLRAPQAKIVRLGTKHAATAHRTASSPVSTAPVPSPGSAQAIARQLLASHGWGNDQYSCLVTLWNHESGWRVHAANPSGAYGIPQALPGSKMSSAGSDWQNSATTQIKWGLNYIAARYNDPCNAWSTWQAHGGWYY